MGSYYRACLTGASLGSHVFSRGGSLHELLVPEKPNESRWSDGFRAGWQGRRGGGPMADPRRPGTPKICIGRGGTDQAAMRRVKQLGVDHVLAADGAHPLAGAGHTGSGGTLQSRRADFVQHHDRRVSSNAIYGRPGRDEEIEKVRQSVRAAGKAGLPVVEYNWFAHRSMEGYHEETRTGRRRLHGVRL